MELISKKGYQKLCDELKDIDNEIKETKRKRRNSCCEFLFSII